MEIEKVIDDLWDIYNCEDGCPDCEPVRERLGFLKAEFRRLSEEAKQTRTHCPVATGTCGGCPYAEAHEDKRRGE